MVTLVFTDIDGSTRLLRQLGDRYGEVLVRHRSLLRDGFHRWDGHELGTEGDSFFVVFERAGDAAHACLAGQRALLGTDWPDGAEVSVRMGIHSGEPSLIDGGYVGMDVHRAARIAAAAHGGQIVASEATRSLLVGSLDADVTALVGSNGERGHGAAGLHSHRRVRC
jgi:class 3 adenylate cyclase